MDLRCVHKREAQKSYKFTVLAECDDDLQCELLSFLNGLEGNLVKHGIRMLNLLERIALEGPPRRVEVCHQIRGPIFQCEQGRIRVLWFYDEGQMIICSHGFLKTSRKTPQRHIHRAESAYQRYFDDKAQGKINIIEDEEETGG
jgi:phage-related protein